MTQTANTSEAVFKSEKVDINDELNHINDKCSIFTLTDPVTHVTPHNT